MLREQLQNQEMLVLVLPALLSLVEHCSEDDYRTLVQPEVKRVLTMTRPVQVSTAGQGQSNLKSASAGQHLRSRSHCAGQ